ncbi:MAG: hypothetical protein QF654_05100, partial [Alphaproteobacteria bacterium]|nr:hypothetical protein [Alphaproteobacteria bacterium]
MAEDIRNDSDDDLELAAELMEIAAARAAGESSVEDAERALSADEGEQADHSLGAMHSGSRTADTLSGVGARNDSGATGLDGDVEPATPDVPQGGGFSDSAASTLGVTEPGTSEFSPSGDATSGTGGVGPGLGVAAEGTAARPLRVAPRLMPESEATTGFQPSIAPGSDDARGADEFLVSPVLDAETAVAATDDSDTETDSETTSTA